MIVEAGAVLERSTVRGPAVIGAGAVIRDAYVGPYTAVGAGCVIEQAEVEHSILLEASEVRHLDGRMESSLLGKNVRYLPRGPASRAPIASWSVTTRRSGFSNSPSGSGRGRDRSRHR